ncbi:MAG: rRNA pseudouridine synthase [Clostridia bacterium]|nr:rRNA pseudouridine synthase [Clostridia bacterium]
MSLQRLDKILSGQNIATRSETKNLVKKGLVTVNGKTVRRSDEKFDPDTDEIIVNGIRIAYKEHLYIMMNKPAGVLSASRDSRTETVIDLLPEHLSRDGLFPAGRLDKDTEGFILITDDGELAHKMLSPKSHVYKLYRAECDRKLTDKDVKAFGEGIQIGDLQFLPAEMKIIGDQTALVEICEGKFHQVKKMFHAVGTEVIKLKRLRIGEVKLDQSLKQGECRELSEKEINDILSRKHGINV